MTLTAFLVNIFQYYVLLLLKYKCNDRSHVLYTIRPNRYRSPCLHISDDNAIKTRSKLV